MEFYTKGAREHLKNQICQALINTASAIAFVAIQETNRSTHYEFKKLNEIYDKLSNLWDYLDCCVNNDLTVHIADCEYNLIKKMSELDVESFKSFYQEYGDFFYI